MQWRIMRAVATHQYPDTEIARSPPSQTLLAAARSTHCYWHEHGVLLGARRKDFNSQSPAASMDARPRQLNHKFMACGAPSREALARALNWLPGESPLSILGLSPPRSPSIVAHMTSEALLSHQYHKARATPAQSASEDRRLARTVAGSAVRHIETDDSGVPSSSAHFPPLLALPCASASRPSRRGCCAPSGVSRLLLRVRFRPLCPRTLSFFARTAPLRGCPGVFHPPPRPHYCGIFVRPPRCAKRGARSVTRGHTHKHKQPEKPGFPQHALSQPPPGLPSQPAPPTSTLPSAAAGNWDAARAAAVAAPMLANPPCAGSRPSIESTGPPRWGHHCHRPPLAKRQSWTRGRRRRVEWGASLAAHMPSGVRERGGPDAIALM